MQSEGPILESLTRRLAETPEDFLAEPRIGNSGSVHLGAVAGDLVKLLGGTTESAELARLEGADPKRDRNRLSVALVMSWLLADDWFRQKKVPAAAVLDLLRQGATELGAQ